MLRPLALPAACAAALVACDARPPAVPRPTLYYVYEHAEPFDVRFLPLDEVPRDGTMSVAFEDERELAEALPRLAELGIPDVTLAFTPASETWSALARLPRLGALGVRTTSAAFAELPRDERLRSLSLDVLDDAGARALAELPSLRALHVVAPLDAATIRALAALPDLRLLDVLRPLDGAALAALPGLTRVEQLWIAYEEPLASAAIDAVSALPSLTSLTLHGAVPAGGLAQMSRLRCLRGLHLGGDRHDQSLAPLARLPLRALTIRGWHGPAAELDEIGALAELESLDLQEGALRGASLGFLARLPRLAARRLRASRR